jgi:hypothetical protein
MKRLDTTHVRYMRLPNNLFIMETICNHGRFNTCCLFLGIEFLSDVITADGVHIKKHIRKGVVDQVHKPSVLANFRHVGQSQGKCYGYLFTETMMESLTLHIIQSKQPMIGDGFVVALWIKCTNDMNWVGK